MATQSLSAPDLVASEDTPRPAVRAGAIDLYGPALGLPKALSGHLAYHDWGLRGFDGNVLIVLDDDRETLVGYFEEVEYGGRVEHPYAMPYQHFDVWVCRLPKVDFEAAWPRLRELGWVDSSRRHGWSGPCANTSHRRLA